MMPSCVLSNVNARCSWATKSSRQCCALVTHRRKVFQSCDASKSRHKRRKCAVTVWAGTIGFNLPGASSDKDIERTADELLLSAASLLVFRNVMTTKVSQAFLRLLQYMQRGSAQQLLEAYGSLYVQLASAGYSSWQDYVLDQILLGSSNAWAKAIARGDITGPVPMDATVAYDLNVLQKLCVTETTLVKWVQRLSPGIPDDWPAAAAQQLPRAALGAAAGSPPDPMRDGGPIPSENELQHMPPLIHLPLLPSSREAWRSELGGRWQWSEFLPQLRYYYATYGTGLMSQYDVLCWTGESFQAFNVKCADDNPIRLRALTAAPVYSDIRKTYWDNIFMHAQGKPSSSVCVVGDERSCMSWFIYPDAAPVGERRPAVRFIKLPVSKLYSVLDLGRALGEHPRQRFVVVVDPLDMGTPTDAYSGLGDALTGGQPSGWPDNALLVVQISAAGGMQVSGHPLSYLVRLCNLRLHFNPLSEAQYLECVARMLGVEDANGHPLMVNAMPYGYKMEHTVRSALEYSVFYSNAAGEIIRQATDPGESAT